MTTRTDVQVDWNASPRVAEVDAPSTDMNMQDLVDTLRKAEDTWRGMSELKLLNASGKEDLGDGRAVGITVALQNLLLAFAARFTPAETGTVTGTPVNPVTGRQTMQDSAALFLTNNVTRGSFLVNFDDMSVADVYRVNSETEIEVRTLVEGTTNTFTNGDNYKIWNITQCTARGGNLTAVDDVQAAINAIQPTAFTQVIIELSTSASLIETGKSGLTAAETLQLNELHGMIQREVYIDTSAVAAGNGYQQTPFNSFTAAVDFAEANGIRHLVLLEDATVDRQLRNFIFRGVGSPTLDINNQDIDRSEFHSLELDGTIGGPSNIVARNCIIRGGTTGLAGDFYNCGFGGALTLALNSDTTMIDCFSDIGGLARPTIDVNGTGSADVSIRSYRGGLTVGGVTGAGDAVTVSLSEGKLTLDNTNTDGVISVRGVSQFTNSTAGTVVDTTGLLDTFQQGLLVKLLRNRMETNPVTGIMTIYDDDDTTVLLQGNIYEDVLASQIYRGRGMERRDRLA